MLRLAFALLVLCSLVYAEELQSSEQPVNEECAIDGNNDFYGLGVRVGIYLVWFSSWLTNNFLDDEIISALETDSIFLLALFATVFSLSVQQNAIRVIDVILIHQLCAGFLFSIMSLWGYRTKYYKTEGPGGRRHFGRIGTHFRLILMTMITGYGVWFWTYGVKDGLSQIDRRQDCGGLVMFFVVPLKVEALSTKIVQLLLSTSYLIYYGSMTIVAALGASVYLVERLRGKRISWELIEESNAETDLTKHELTIWYRAVSVFNLFWIFLSILCLEGTIRLNFMQNVIGSRDTSPGQIIPLLIGIVSLSRLLCVLVRSKMKERKKGQGNETAVGGYSNITQLQDLDHTKKTDDASPMTPASGLGGTTSGVPRRRNLKHRTLLAWFPWLRLFSFFRRPIDVLPFHLRHSTPQRYQGRYESIKTSKDHTHTAESERHDAALLADLPELLPDQKGLMASSPRTSHELADQDIGSAKPRGRDVYDSDGY